MQDLGYNISPKILADHKKISDLISYEGPILSHFRNTANEDFIYYWIDENERLYRWLVFKIDIGLIKEYLSGSISLRELITNEKVQYYFIADYGNASNTTFENVFLLEQSQIGPEYLPDDDSYFSFDLPKVYDSLFKTSEISQIEYLQLLKEHAIFIKFSDKVAIHKHILSIDDVTSYLDKVKKSYNSYVEESFKKNFLSLFTNLTDLSKAIDRIIDNLQLRVVDAKIASFGIGLSADTVMLSEDIKREVREWSKSVISDYNNEVLELDYYNLDNLNYVLKNYSPEARKNIFKPILDIYSNPEVEVSVSEKNFSTLKKVKKPSKALVKQLTEIPVQPKAEPREKEFVTIAVEIDKGADLSKIPKKVFSSQPLFEKRSDNIELTKTILTFDELSISFTTPLVLNVSVKNGIHAITAIQINLAVEHEDLNEGIRLLTSLIYNYWLKFHELKISFEEYKKLDVTDPIIIVLLPLIEKIIEPQNRTS